MAGNGYKLTFRVITTILIKRLSGEPLAERESSDPRPDADHAAVGSIDV